MEVYGAGYFYENDTKVTKSAVKVLRWLILVFPLLMILSVAGIFQIKINELILLTLIGIVVTMGPGVVYKMNVPIGIYMTYAFAMVFTLFYYDKKFTIRISVISYILLVISLYFRSLFALLQEVQSSNQENIANVAKETEKLYEIGKEAEGIGELQERSDERVRVAADSSADTVEQSEELLRISHDHQA